MTEETYQELVKNLVGHTVPRPNRADNGTLSGHAAGEPFEKHVYRVLKEIFPHRISKQHEYLNALFLDNPKALSATQRMSLLHSPVARFLLCRSEHATQDWSPAHPFKEKQDDTADILWHGGRSYDLIDVKTKNQSKKSMPPNIISAYKLARACALMLDNDDFSCIDIHYVEVEWKEEGDLLRCVDAYWADLFKCPPESLYINWSAAMQIQFHVSDIPQTFVEGKEHWAHGYLIAFTRSAMAHCKRIQDKYIASFERYLSGAEIQEKRPASSILEAD